MNGKIKVLLIEDNPGDVRLIQEMLADIGNPPLDLEWADRLSKGMERLGASRFDALLLDLELPDSEGIETLERILEHAPDVPIVVFTGSIDESTGIQAVQKGAQDYLVKGSVSSDLLVRSVRYSIERKRLMTELLTLSIRDELTGLHNRRGFFTLAEQMLKLAKRETRSLIFLIADLDGLKTINDTLGHQKGDEALRDAAGVLKETFRASDVIGRIGGDEFAACLIEDEESSAEIIMKRIGANLATYNRPGDRPFELSLSVGISRCGAESSCSVDEMLSQADNLMYEEKRKKRRESP
jgi:diguanylate cyclase (GGDEF)-like protein